MSVMNYIYLKETQAVWVQKIACIILLSSFFNLLLSLLHWVQSDVQPLNALKTIVRFSWHHLQVDVFVLFLFL